MTDCVAHEGELLSPLDPNATSPLDPNATMSAPMIKLFGSSLLSADGTVTTADALKGKRVAIYFSAHWCPPCRGFTPKLAERYTELKAKAEAFEIVFVSSDRDEESFKEYFGSMPWLALPFDDREAKAKLSKKYKVSGIPALIILDEQGEIVNKEGRSCIMDDPATWKPPTLFEALSGDLLTRDGDATVDEVRQESDVIALYFSAHWCPPCKGFTPKLAATYEKLKAAGKRLSVVFCSSDRDMKQFSEYFGEMPDSWYAIPPDDKRKEQLSTLFEVEGIPSLVILDAATGETINGNARGAVMGDAEGAKFPWKPPPVADLGSPDGINETASVCLFAEGCSTEEQEALLSMLTPMAVAAKAKEEDLIFFIATEADGVPTQVRKLTKIGEPQPKPQLILLDIPDSGGYYTCASAELTEASVGAFLDAYRAGTLERQQLDRA